MENLQERLVLSSSSSSSSSCSSCSSSSNPHLMSFTAECWSITKLTTQEILCAIQPTIVSEQRRKEIIDYVRRLIRDSFGNEVRDLYIFLFLWKRCWIKMKDLSLLLMCFFFLFCLIIRFMLVLYVSMSSLIMANFLGSP